METRINNQLDAINFLQEYLQNGNHEALIDLLHEIAQEINLDQHKNSHSYSAINNNHFHLSTTFNPNLQLSNNKEKKTKKEKSDNKGKKDSNENKPKKHDKKKEKTKKIEDTTTDSESLTSPPVINFHNPQSPVETIGFPSFSIPVPHSNGSSTIGLMPPNPSQSNIQHQLQSDPQNPSVQQQLQSLSQMARDGDEILITLSVNALAQQQQRIDNNNNIQNNPYFSQSWNHMMPSSTSVMMPRNLEIVAKGFARVQNDHPQPSLSNTYPQQQPIMYSYNQPASTMVHPSFTSRYPIPCHSASGPPQIPIGPPIQPIFAPPHTMMSGGSIQPPNRRNNFDDTRNRSHISNGRCDNLCQSSLYQPDFCGRPSPGLMINPYIINSPPPMNFSAKRSSKHRRKITL